MLCGTNYKIPQGIPKDPKKVPRPTRAKTPTRPSTPRSPRARTPTSSKHVSFDKKDEEIKRLRQLNKELKKNLAPNQDNDQQNEELENLKNLKEAKASLGTLQKLGVDTKDIQAKIDALEAKCTKTPQNANSETLKRKLRNAENRANQLAQNVHKTTELLESQKNSLADAEEEVQRLTEEHKNALKSEGFEKAAVPGTLLQIPEHLEGQTREQYKAKLEELAAIEDRYRQEAAAITGNLQAFALGAEKTKPPPPKEEKLEDAMDEDTHANQNGEKAEVPKPNKEELEAAKKLKDEKRAQAEQAAQARVELVAAEAAKKQRISEAVPIEEDF